LMWGEKRRSKSLEFANMSLFFFQRLVSWVVQTSTVTRRSGGRFGTCHMSWVASSFFFPFLFACFFCFFSPGRSGDGSFGNKSYHKSTDAPGTISWELIWIAIYRALPVML
jgi:hypothetical protein